MGLTEQQLAFVEAAINSRSVQEFVQDVFWPMYDIWREEGELPEIGSNPHVSPLMFALVGYPFSVRDGLEEMKGDLDGVIEKLSNGTVQSPWMP